jgi:Flp pilus assembly protein TadG
MTLRQKQAYTRPRSGATLPIIVLMLAVFIGITAFAIDISRMFVVRAELQTSADAGAIAGAMQFMDGIDPTGYDSAYAYTQRNLAEATAPTIGSGDILPGTWDGDTRTFTPSSGWTDPTNTAVQVITHHTSDYILGKIYDLTTAPMEKLAVATVGSVVATDCVRPLAIPYRKLLDVLYPGENKPVTYELSPEDIETLRDATSADAINLKIGDASESVVNGSFYAVREGPIVYADGTVGDPWQGANDYGNALSATCNNLTPIIGVGDWLQAEQGNMVGPTRSGVADVCGAKAQGNNPFTCPNPIDYIVPIWDIDDKTVASPNAFRVKYVGVFRVTGYASGGIVGYFRAMNADGAFSPKPGPVQKTALVK